MKFYHEGKPIPKMRPKFSKGRTYDPQHKEKTNLKWLFASQFREQGHLNRLKGPICAEVNICIEIPKSWSKKAKRNANYATSRPDLDNYCKMYFDVLNEIAYDDDSQITTIHAQKRYSEKAGVEINLSEEQLDAS